MSMESMVSEALQGLVAGRVFPDLAASGTARPFITFRAVGGTPITFLDGSSPARENVRVQVSVWAATRSEASTLGKQAEDALRAATGLQTTVLTGRSANVDSATESRCTLQEFEFFV